MEWEMLLNLSYGCIEIRIMSYGEQYIELIYDNKQRKKQEVIKGVYV